MPILFEIMKPIIVTGGAGYAGFTITQRLAERYPERKIIVFDRNQRACIELMPSLIMKLPNIELVPYEKADIRDTKSFEETLVKYRPEAVINLAAKVTNFSKDQQGKNEECMATNHEALVTIAALSKKHNVRAFVHQSSVSVYAPGDKIKEDTMPGPSSVYGQSKLLGEKELMSLHDNSFRVITFRAATIIGYNIHFKYETMVNLMCIKSIFKIPFTIFESALDNDKTYLDIEDNARAIIFALEHSERLGGEIINLASFDATLREALSCIKDELKEDFPYTILREEKKNKQVYTIDFGKLEYYGFKSRRTFKEVIKEVMIYLKKTREFYGQSLLS